jgi:2-succinyl-5-enolpyruvyl-6-hydroxy-3-cyclohexene-1-carboxylate synthase
MRIDERSAAFFALGLAKASNKYVALICTSGTAVANYHPAILEAFHSQVPVIAVTADRPERLRFTGANQTTVQANIFPLLDSFDLDSQIDDSEFVLLSEEIISELGGAPAHINLQLEEPLVEGVEDKSWLEELKTSTAFSRNWVAPVEAQITLSAKTVAVIGFDRGGFSREEINYFISALTKQGVPVIAEDPSISSEVINHSALFLAVDTVKSYLQPDHIIVVGRTTLSRSINAFIASANHSTVIDKRLETVDTSRKADQPLTSIPVIHPAIESEKINLFNSITEKINLFNSRWELVSRKMSEFLSQQKNEWFEPNIVNSIYSQLPAGSTLFIGSSRPIRDIEARGEYRADVTLYANRGLAGIDGNIATTFGIAEHCSPTVAIMGDVTFQHDFSTLLTQPSSPVTIFVIDNNGGGIFNTLEQNGVDGFETVFATPHNRDLEAITAPLGFSTRTISTSEELHKVVSEISTPPSNSQIIFVKAPSRVKMVDELNKEKNELKSFFDAVDLTK